MEVSPFVPLPDGLHIVRVTASAHELLVQVLISSPKALYLRASPTGAMLPGDGLS
jgi:hypothetical protein